MRTINAAAVIDRIQEISKEKCIPMPQNPGNMNFIARLMAIRASKIQKATADDDFHISMRETPSEGGGSTGGDATDNAGS